MHRTRTHASPDTFVLQAQHVQAHPLREHPVQDRTAPPASIALTAFLAKPPTVEFHTPDCVGTVEFRDTGGQELVLADVYSTHADPLACAPCDIAHIAATPAQAEVLGFALIAWAQHAKNRARRAQEATRDARPEREPFGHGGRA